ncbi:MAG: 2-phosphosulfolactate phosphatase [Pirellulales bacterium]
MGAIYAHLLPALVSGETLAGGAVVVIDVLRASTTVVAALNAGAPEVIPCLEVADALRRRSELGGGVLGGERHGQRIPGFDLGNSPADYSPWPAERSGQSIIFTTTNGTRALLAAEQARSIWIGCFANLSAVVDRAAREPDVHLLCAGTDGQVTAEDVLFAGAVADRLEAAGGQTANDSARMARDLWRAGAVAADREAWLVEQMLLSQGGRNLVELGMESDVRWAAVIDRCSVVPAYDRQRGVIRVA